MGAKSDDDAQAGIGRRKKHGHVDALLPSGFGPASAVVLTLSATLLPLPFLHSPSLFHCSSFPYTSGDAYWLLAPGLP